MNKRFRGMSESASKNRNQFQILVDCQQRQYLKESLLLIHYTKAVLKIYMTYLEIYSVLDSKIELHIFFVERHIFFMDAALEDI